MSLSKQEQERQVAQLKAEHPELQKHNTWTCIKGEMVPEYEAEYRDENTTGIRNEIFDTIKKYSSLRTGALALLLYFIRHRNWTGRNDGKHNVISVWRKQKGLIVCSRSKKTIAEELGVSKRTIRNWTKELVADGLVQVVVENRENVYIIGRIVDRKETYFYDN
jgi:hypothetical protein